MSEPLIEKQLQEKPPFEENAKRRNIVTAILAITILVPSLWGFGSKFSEFLRLVSGEVDGTFAVTPVVNYLLASLGFLCLFGWAAMNGMFNDIEEPKRTMLETENQLNTGMWQPTGRCPSRLPSEEGKKA